MKIKNIELDNPIILSPMAGAGDFAFRAICRQFGADLSYTEMISVKGLKYNSERTKKMLYCLEDENPKAVQLFGSDEQDFFDACKMPEIEEFDIIDLNFGCPVQKVFSNEEGSALLDKPNQIYKIVSACVKATDKPVTAKIRLGVDEKKVNGIEIAKICEDAGASLVTVHGRLRSQMYSGVVDYEQIAKIKASVKIPVIGNGDIVDKTSLEKMRQTGVDGVSLARGALGSPWIFAILKQKDIQIDKIEVIKKHINLLQTKFADEWIVKYFRKHFLWYLKGYNCPTLKVELSRTDNLQVAIKKLEDFFAKNSN